VAVGSSLAKGFLLVRPPGVAAPRDRLFDLSQFYTPLGIALVLALSFLLLMVVVRSVVLSALGVALNLLSAGAAHGLLVLVFQHGTGAALFDFQQVDTIGSGGRGVGR
jgi:hypothetical protein